MAALGSRTVKHLRDPMQRGALGGLQHDTRVPLRHGTAKRRSTRPTGCRSRGSPRRRLWWRAIAGTGKRRAIGLYRGGSASINYPDSAVASCWVLPNDYAKGVEIPDRALRTPIAISDCPPPA